MSHEAARAKFADEFTTLWDADYPTVPIAFENRKFKQPVNAPWVDFSVVETTRKRQSVGPTTKRFVRAKGLIVILVYVPEDSGSSTLFTMMGKITTYLEERKFPLSTGISVTTLVGERHNDQKQANGFYRGTVMIPYWLDEQLPQT
jgi:hypothetical protein